jgi:N-acetylmuramoyl-L-alanine amidase CwlA
MNIIQRLIPASNKETRPGYKLTPTYLTIHETDNEGFKANAEAHARLQESGNSRQASWHLSVDDQYCYQSIPFNEVAWAAGDGANGPGNRKSIHLEICVNKDGDFKKAVANAAEVAKRVMAQFEIPVENVVQHNHWSGKNCPRHLRSGDKGVNWDQFVSSLKEEPQTVKSIGVLKIDYNPAYGVNAYHSPNGAYKQKLKGGTSWMVYAEKDGFYDIGQSTWVPKKYCIYKGV